MAFRPIDSSRLVRKDKKELDMEIFQAVKESEASDTAIEYEFESEKAAKATVTKLRTFLNSTDRGLRATKPYEIEGGWAVAFKVEPKRVVNKTAE